MSARRSAPWACLIALVVLGLGCRGQGDAPQPKAPAAAPQSVQSASAAGTTVSGPFRHGNLAVFLVHGKNTIDGTAFLTLDEALAKKVLVVHETEEVRELTVDNLSETESIFVQGGEIVSGGKQDRMLGVDLVVAPKARGVKIASFCVESGRWSQRGDESAGFFYSNLNAVPSNQSKLAALLNKDQGKVWESIAKSQNALTSNAGYAGDTISPTSLDLTLEDPKVKAAVKGYTDPLATAAEGKEDVIGCAFAINGQLYSADVYGSSVLFRKLWPKLLEASATEAVAKLQKGKAFDAPTPDAVVAWINKPRDSKAALKALSERVAPSIQARTIEMEDHAVLETWDEKAGASFHKSIMAKPGDEK